MTAKWGNPETKSFERQYLRWARYDETAIQVHKHVWPLVERILIGLDGMGLDPRSVRTNEDDPLRLSFHLPVGDQDAVNEMLTPASFSYDGATVRFIGTPDTAAEFSALLGATPDEEPQAEPDPIAPEEPRGQTAPPYTRSLEDPATVRFLHELIIPPGVDIEFDAALRSYQSRHGVEATGELDENTWASIKPRRQKWIRPGATGDDVKVLQAAFRERGYYDTAVTGVWGIQMSQALRRFQHDYGIHPRLRIGSPEWTALFGDTRSE